MFDKISKITLKLTGYCNLACEYCHQLNEDKKTTTEFSKFKELYEFMLRVEFTDEVEVTLTGGEITTSPEAYATAVKWFKKIERRIPVRFTFAVVSNGTNLDQLFDWIEKKVLNPKRTTISWDGLYTESKSRRSKNSKYTDEFFQDVIRRIGASPYAKQICLTHSIGPSTIDHMAESFRFAVDAGVKNIGYYYVHEADYNNDVFLAKFSSQLELIADLFMERYQDPKTRFIYWNWQLLWSKLGLGQDKMLASTMCHKLGKTLHVDPQGDIYGCVYFGDHRALQLGTLSEGCDKDRIQRFMDEYFAIPKCGISSCGNHQCFECPAANYVTNGSMAQRFSNTCRMLDSERAIFTRHIQTMEITEHDKLYYWMDQDNLGSKDYHEKKNDIEGVMIPLGEGILPEEKKKVSNTLGNVKTWMMRKV